jgi:glycine/D-amino acid oxidase-like deaminating enzyme
LRASKGIRRATGPAVGTSARWLRHHAGVIAGRSPQPTSPSPDVLVIGGGIVGTAAAAFLAEGGASVVLVEREGLASGASGANSGVVQHPFDPVLAVLYRETVALYRELAAADLGFRLADEPAGLLYVSPDEAAVRGVDRSLAAAFPDLDRIVAGGAALNEIEPAVGPDLWACRVGIGFPVQPAASTYAYASLAERRGAAIRLGRSATLAVDGDRVVGAVVDGQSLLAGAVLVAAGPWSAALVDPTGRWAPIRHRWGVVVEVDLARPPVHVLEEAEIGAVIGTDQVAARSDGRDGADPGDAADPANEALLDFSLVPGPGGTSVGSTFLGREPDPADWIEPTLVRAAGFVPALADAPIRGTRACARPQSRDGRPLIGRVPGRDGLFICAGHGSWGISTGPAAARLVTDLIMGRDAGIPDALAADRFGAPA